MNDNTLVKVNNEKQAKKILDYLEEEGFSYSETIDRDCVIKSSDFFKYIGIYNGEIRHCVKYSGVYMNCEIIPYWKFKYKGIKINESSQRWLVYSLAVYVGLAPTGEFITNIGISLIVGLIIGLQNEIYQQLVNLNEKLDND